MTKYQFVSGEVGPLSESLNDEVRRSAPLDSKRLVSVQHAVNIMCLAFLGASPKKAAYTLPHHSRNVQYLSDLRHLLPLISTTSYHTKRMERKMHKVFAFTLHELQPPPFPRSVGHPPLQHLCEGLGIG